ncbi:hypothetical protein CEXT_616861 [Caerostris extrusa]|uniref:Uncharacterized protein n=1 Tax=Caerostris extrusa TaxID=172846 RepID=A0AAV4QS98_CAEEX|nr:hypothetical protein CEXT_616861 [Caerostris extrusa]
MVKHLSNCRRKIFALTPAVLEGFPSLFLAGHGKDHRLMITMGTTYHTKGGPASHGGGLSFNGNFTPSGRCGNFSSHCVAVENGAYDLSLWANRGCSGSE